MTKFKKNDIVKVNSDFAFVKNGILGKVVDVHTDGQEHEYTVYFSKHGRDDWDLLIDDELERPSDEEVMLWKLQN